MPSTHSAVMCTAAWLSLQQLRACRVCPSISSPRLSLEQRYMHQANALDVHGYARRHMALSIQHLLWHDSLHAVPTSSLTALNSSSPADPSPVRSQPAPQQLLTWPPPSPFISIPTPKNPAEQEAQHQTPHLLVQPIPLSLCPRLPGMCSSCHIMVSPFRRMVHRSSMCCAAQASSTASALWRLDSESTRP